MSHQCGACGLDEHLYGIDVDGEMSVTGLSSVYCLLLDVSGVDDLLLKTFECDDEKSVFSDFSELVSLLSESSSEDESSIKEEITCSAEYR